MADTGILIVSHSKNLAQGLFDLISQVAADVGISYVGGLDDGSIGTSFEGIQAALDANDKDTILAFFDLGSARMNLEMVADFSDKEIIINNVPLVEGAYTAAALLQAGADLPNVLLQVRELEIRDLINDFICKIRNILYQKTGIQPQFFALSLYQFSGEQPVFLILSSLE